MCSPVFIPVAIAATAAVYQGVAGLYSSKYQRAMIGAQKDLERQKHDQTLIAGRLEAKRAAVAAHQALGAQKAAIGASGTVSTTGSNLDVIAENAALGQMDQEVIRTNYERQAYSHLQNITMLENQSKQVKWAGRMNLYGSLLTLSSATAQTLGTAFSSQQMASNFQQTQPQTTRMRTGSYSPGQSYYRLPYYDTSRV